MNTHVTEEENRLKVVDLKQIDEASSQHKQLVTERKSAKGGIVEASVKS